MKNLWTPLMGLAVAATMAIPAGADQLNARIKAVDVDKGIVTVVEGKKDYALSVTADTKFLNSKDGALANGIKSGDLKDGRRVTVNFDSKDNVLVLNSLKIRE